MALLLQLEQPMIKNDIELLGIFQTLIGQDFTATYVSCSRTLLDTDLEATHKTSTEN